MDKKAGFKALAKRPKLVKFISKGTEFHKLKEIGEVSGGFIRNLMKVGIVSKDDGIVTFVKDMEKQIGQEPKQEKNVKEKTSKKAKRKAKDEDEDEEDEEQDEKPAKKNKRAAEQQEEEDDEESDKDLRRKRKKNKEKPAKAPKKSAVEKTAVVKLKKPIKDIPANHKEDAEYYDGFWWVRGFRVATQNLMFLKGPE